MAMWVSLGFGNHHFWRGTLFDSTGMYTSHQNLLVRQVGNVGSEPIPLKKTTCWMVYRGSLIPCLSHQQEKHGFNQGGFEDTSELQQTGPCRGSNPCSDAQWPWGRKGILVYLVELNGEPFPKKGKGRQWATGPVLTHQESSASFPKDAHRHATRI